MFWPIRVQEEMPTKLLIIGISGVTCGGKTTLACNLNKCLPNSRLICQDDYFLDLDDARHTRIPELNHINFEVMSSLDMEKMDNDILAVIKDKELVNIDVHNMNGKMPSIRSSDNLKVEIFEKMKNSDLEILIIEGFSIFNYKPIRDVPQLKYYITLPKQECFQRRSQRVYEPPDCPGYFEQCAWPEHVQQLREIQKEVTDIKYFDGLSTNSLDNVLVDIGRIIDANTI